MARFLALLGLCAVAEETLDALNDDSCLAGEPCELSLRQLRGERISQLVVEGPLCAAYGCGQFVRGHPCQCTAQCAKYGNCCSDYKDICEGTSKKLKAAAIPLCAKLGCTSKYQTNQPCQCTPKCGKFGNCCSDYKEACLADTEETQTTTSSEPEVETTTDSKCETAKRGDECWVAAMADGIYEPRQEHPEWWPELQPGASSFEEFQAHQHLMNSTLCPQPCMLRYKQYSVPTYRSNHQYPMKGVSYGASPLKNTGVLLTDDDFMTDITGAMWDSWGRGDLDLLKSMGVNTLRMYGNDLNYSHRSFLDGAWKRDMDIIVGLSDWGFIQGPDPCDRYKKSIFWSDEMKIPLFIGEYHSVHVGAKDDLPILVEDALSKTYPFFLGYNFFEFSVRYDKGGSEKKFGMFGYGSSAYLGISRRWTGLHHLGFGTSARQVWIPAVHGLEPCLRQGQQLAKTSKSTMLGRDFGHQLR
eukprot:s32_g53.t1